MSALALAPLPGTPELQSAMERLGGQSALTVKGLYESIGVHLSDEEFREMAQAAIIHHNVQGVRLAHQSVNALLLANGKELAIVGAVRLLDHFMTPERLSKAVDTALTIPEQAVTRLTRLANAEPIEAAQRSIGDMIRRSPAVNGWERVLEPNACELCQWWHRDGRVWPPNHSMPTHKGCTCAQRPVLSTNVTTVGYDAAKESAARNDYGSVDKRRQVSPGAYSSRAQK